jgi:hypothetical protein
MTDLESAPPARAGQFAGEAREAAILPAALSEDAQLAVAHLGRALRPAPRARAMMNSTASGPMRFADDGCVLTAKYRCGLRRQTDGRVR